MNLLPSFVLVAANQLQADETVKCPVSGKEIKKSDAKGTYEYDGKTYYFCCENCKEAFVKELEKYIEKFCKKDVGPVFWMGSAN